MDTTQKRERLHQVVRGMESALVTLSGGIDSTLLSKIAHLELGERSAAVTADSPSLAREELEDCKQIARDIGIRHFVVETHEMDDPNYSSNPSNRCYFCKDELFAVAVEEAKKRGFAWILEGTHVGDLSGHRPGYQAAKEHGVRSPYVEAGFTKSDIREYAHEMGLSNWDKPALACLSSRFPTGTEITRERLETIEQAESVIRATGVRQCRARFHEHVLRIELAEEEFAGISYTDFRGRISDCLHALRFEKVVVDLLPYGTKSTFPATLPFSDDDKLRRARKILSESTHGHCQAELSGEILILALPESSLADLIHNSELRRTILEGCRALGFKYVTLDIDPLEELSTTGSLIGG